MRKFVVIVSIISIVALAILALISFFGLKDITSGFTLLFAAVFTSVQLAWLCSIDDTANRAAYSYIEIKGKIEELTRALNETRNIHNKSLKEIEELKVQIAYISGQQATEKETRKK